MGLEQEVANVMSELKRGHGRSLFGALAVVRTNLIKSTNGRSKLVEAGAVKLLLMLIGDKARHEGQAKMADIVMSIMANLCLDSSAREQILKFGGLETIANFTMAVEQESLQNRGVRALANLAQSEVVIEELFNLEVPEFVAVRLLETEDEECQVTYCRAIRQFGKTNILVRRLVEDTQAIQALATMIKLDRRSLVLKGLRILAEFTSKWCCQQFTAQILAAKVLEKIVTFAEDEDNDVAHFSLTLVHRLCEQSIIRPALGAAGAVSLLVRLMSSSRPQVNHVLVLNTLCLCSRDSVNRNRIRDSGGLEVFVSVLKEEDAEKGNVDEGPKHGKRSKFSVLYDRVISCLVNFIYHDGCLKLLHELGLVDVLLTHLQRCTKFIPRPCPHITAELQRLSQALHVEIEQNIAGHESENADKQKESHVQEHSEVETRDRYEPEQVETDKSDCDKESKSIHGQGAKAKDINLDPKLSCESVKPVNVLEQEISNPALDENLSNTEKERQEEERLSQNILSRDPLNIDNQVLCNASQSSERDTQPVIEDDFAAPRAGPSTRNSKHTFSINSPSYQSESSWRMEDYSSGVTCINYSSTQPSPAQLLSPASYRSSPYSPLSADLSYYSPTHSLSPTYSRSSLSPPQALWSPLAGFSPSLTMSDLSSVQTSPYASPYTGSSIGPFSPLSTAELSVPLSPISTASLPNSPQLNSEVPEGVSGLRVSGLSENIFGTDVETAMSTQSNLSIVQSPVYSATDEEEEVANIEVKEAISVNLGTFDVTDDTNVKSPLAFTNDMSPVSSLTGEKSISNIVIETDAARKDNKYVLSIASTLKSETASEFQSLGEKSCSNVDFKTTEKSLSVHSPKRFKLSSPSEYHDIRSGQLPSTSGQNPTDNLETKDLSMHSETYMRQIVPRSSKLSKKLQRFVCFPGPESLSPAMEASFKKRGSQPQPKASSLFHYAEGSFKKSIIQSLKQSPSKSQAMSPVGEKANQSMQRKKIEEVELNETEDDMSDVGAENKDRQRGGESERRNKIMRVSESNILILLSTLSVKANYMGALVEAKVTSCLLQYLRDSPAPLQRCCRILTRLFSNPLIFQKLIVHQIPALIVKHLILQKDGTFPSVMFCAEWENKFGQIQQGVMDLSDLLPPNQTSDMEDGSHTISASQASDFGRKLEFEFGSDAYSRAKSLRSDTPSVHRLFRYLYHDSPSLSVDSQSARDEPSVSQVHREDVFPPGSDRVEAQVRIGLGLLRSLSAVALSSYGEGEIQHVLRRASETDLLACHLSLMHLPIPWGKMTRQQLAIKYHSAWKFMLPCLFMDAAPFVIREAVLVMLSFSLHLDVPAKKTLKLNPIAPCPDVSQAESSTPATGMNRMLSDAAVGSQSPKLFIEDEEDRSSDVQGSQTNLRGQDCPYWDKASSHDMFLVIREKTITVRYGCERAVMMRKSEVFAAMLGGAYAESSKAEILLTDTKAGSFECILHYLHGCTNYSCTVMERLTAFNPNLGPCVKDISGWDSPRSQKDADTGLRCSATLDQEPVSSDIMFSQEVNCGDSQEEVSLCSNPDQELESSGHLALESAGSANNLRSNNTALNADIEYTPANSNFTAKSSPSMQNLSVLHDFQDSSTAPNVNVERADIPVQAVDLPTLTTVEKNLNIEKALLSLEEHTDHCVEILALADRYLLSELVSHIGQILSHICLQTHTWEELFYVACFYKLPYLAQDCLREALLANQPASVKVASILDLSTKGYKEQAIEALNKLFNLI